MKLTVITINFNNKQGLQRTFDSVVSQTWKDYEWIVVDGGSTDGSKELIEDYVSQGCFSWWCSEKDKGVYNAMNKGIAHASGEYLLFMNSGDCFHDSDVLRSVSEELKDADIIYGSANYIFEDHEEVRSYPYPMNLDFFIDGCTVNHQSSFIKTSYQKEHLYDESYRICADLRFFMEAQLNKAVYNRIDKIVADFYADGISQKQRDMVWQENLRTYEDLLSTRFFPPCFKTLIEKYHSRRLYKRLIDSLARIL